MVNLGWVLSRPRPWRCRAPTAPPSRGEGVTDALRMEFAVRLSDHVTLIKPGPIDTPYMEHARNLMGSLGTRNPPPAYHPRVVARAILHACENAGVRPVVGGGGWAISVIGRRRAHA